MDGLQASAAAMSDIAFALRLRCLRGCASAFPDSLRFAGRGWRSG